MSVNNGTVSFLLVLLISSLTISTVSSYSRVSRYGASSQSTTTTTTTTTTTIKPVLPSRHPFNANEAAPETHCPIGYGRHGTTCLKMSKDFAAYSTAEAACRVDGGRLASPKSSEVQAHIKKVAESSRTASYWIGLKKVNRMWTFSDGSPVGVFKSWAEGQPLPGDDNECAVMSMRFNHTWLSTGCKWAWRYICQFQLENARYQPDQAEMVCNSRDLRQYHFHLSGSHTTEFHPVGATVPTECDDGYAVMKPFLIECTTGGSWKVDGSCLRVCPLLALPPHLRYANGMLPRLRLEGDWVTFACPDDHIMKGDKSAVCRPDGTWSTSAPECEAKKSNLATSDCSNAVAATTATSKTELQDEEELSSTSWTVLPDVEFLREGQSLQLSCVQHFRIEPRSVLTKAREWTWMKEQHIIVQPEDTRYPNLKVDEDGNLLILKMAKHLEGMYTCVTYVDDERAVTFRSIHVALHTKCSMKFEIEPKDTVVFEGGYAILRCYVPNAVISWSKGTVPVTSDATHRVLRNGALLIRNARRQDTATYECSAEDIKTKCRIKQSVSVEVSAAAAADICGKPASALGNSSKYDTTSFVPNEDRGKIVGGEEADRGAHPWIALVVGSIPRGGSGSTTPKPIKIFCGGSLINNHWVVTAAHCFRTLPKPSDIEFIKVKLGKHDRTITEREERLFSIERLVTHPYFNMDSFDNDITLIKLSERVYYSDHILPICLPPSGYMEPHYRSGSSGGSTSSGVVVGWGWLKEGGLQPSELRSVQLPIVEQDLCKRSTAAIVTPNMFCAGYKLSVADACRGDSGGPFELRSDGKAYLAGIVSWGEGCARPAKYGFYTKVENYVDFIKNNIN